MPQRQKLLFILQVWQQVGHRGQDSHAAGPIVAVAGAEQGRLPDNVALLHTSIEQGQSRLAHDESEVMLHPFLESVLPMRQVIARLARQHPDFLASDVDRIPGNVISPEMERAAAGQVEPGVVPIAGEDAVFHTPAMQRKAHVRTAVFHGEDFPVVVEHRDGLVQADHHAGFGFKFF